jgi:hypothetical protein
LLLSLEQELITEMIKINPNYKPPADYRPEKKYRKLRIPIDDYPGYNFIGLIIGPRGNTQKRMEKVRRQMCWVAAWVMFVSMVLSAYSGVLA